jgi:hypothetical protein
MWRAIVGVGGPIFLKGAAARLRAALKIQTGKLASTTL